MHVLTAIQVLMAWAFVQCMAAPHLLTLLNGGVLSVHDLKDRGIPLGMIPGSKQFLRQDPTPAAQATGPAPFATVASSFDATSLASIEQIESSEGVPFRRDLNSVVAQNIPTLMETKTNSGIPGFEAFAEAVRQGIADGKRDLTGLFTRGLFTRDSQLSDFAECGGRLSCFKKRVVNVLGLTTRETQVSDFAECGGRLSCFKKRIVDGLGLITRETQVSDFAECGGRLSCFKKRVVDDLGLTTRETQVSDFAECGGRLSCFKKRALDKAINLSPSLTPREPIPQGPIFHQCDGGLCFLDEDKVEKRTVDDLALKPREPTAEPQFHQVCHGKMCMEEQGEKRTVEDSALEAREPVPQGPIFWCDGVPCNAHQGKPEERTADNLNLSPRDATPDQLH